MDLVVLFMLLLEFLLEFIRLIIGRLELVIDRLFIVILEIGMYTIRVINMYKYIKRKKMLCQFQQIMM